MDIEAKRWWLGAVGYIINPSSFKDGNDDGVGDLYGMKEKLPYLEELGVNLLWVLPLFDSPLEDNGYDVRDYYKIHPLYGDNETLRSFVEEAHKRGIRVLLDLAMNHTSDEHPWFQEALRDPSSPKRDYYLFRKGRYVDGKLLPPNNWMNFFGESAWERVGESEDFYFHIFSRKMPDTNWNNPLLREEYKKIANFWLDMGVDGFRLDALSHLAKDLSFEDAKGSPNAEGLILDESRFSNRPELLDYLRDFRAGLKTKKDVLLIGEASGTATPEGALPYVNRENGPLNLLFNFDTAWSNHAYDSLGKDPKSVKTDVLGLKKAFARWYDVCYKKADMPIYWCNHDHPRLLNQYGSIEKRSESSKMLCLALLYLYGTPFIYQGDEIGMSNLHLNAIEDFYLDKSNIALVKEYRKEGHTDKEILDYLNRTARLNARSPFQWNRDLFAGFSTKYPKIPVNPNYLSGVNLHEEMRDPYSIVNFWQYAILYRRRPIITDILTHPNLRWIDFENPDVFAYFHDGSFRVAVICNMRPYEVKFPFYYSLTDMMLHNYGDVLLEEHVFTLRPYECYLLEIR